MFYFELAMVQRHFEQSDQDVLPFIKSPILNDPELFSLLRQLHIAIEEPAFDITKESWRFALKCSLSGMVITQS